MNFKLYFAMKWRCRIFILFQCAFLDVINKRKQFFLSFFVPSAYINNYLLSQNQKNLVNHKNSLLRIQTVAVKKQKPKETKK